MRTDAILKTEVLNELKWWPNVNEAHIGVTATDGVVALTGHVAHYSEKLAAEDAAKGVYGVKGLANDIQVEMLGSHKQSDSDIAAGALSAMALDYQIPNDKIQVIVKDGWITLKGQVEWQFQKDAASRCVRNLRGVSMVSNEITITPLTKWIDVKSKIEDALRRNADLESRRISVVTDGSAVTLRGSVASWSERSAAFWAAWSAPGVTSVENELVITP
jgi:osmotically-inducible protein OsmY